MSDEPDGKRAETIDAVSRELTDIEIWINEGRYDSVFTSLYPGRDINTCKTRYSGLIKIYRESYLNDIDKNTINANESEAGKVVIVSAPGRTEVCGNHTDHQHGNVLAAAIDLDIICVAAPNERNAIRLQSIGHAGSIYVDLCDLSPNDGERGDAAALVRGLAAWFSSHGVKVGGFDAYTTSDVLVGSGLSSSAAFEVAVGTAMNIMFNAGFSKTEIAMAGQYAENQFFGKPCGLMDQTASSVGGFVRIDFADPKNPIVEPIQYDPAEDGLCLCVVNTKGSHADLIGEYAAIPEEMRAVAVYFGKDFLRDVDEDEFYNHLAEMREMNMETLRLRADSSSAISAINDRALLRAIHFFRENRLVVDMADALRAADTARFLNGINQSGLSSFNYLQNIYASSSPGEQGLSIALAFSEKILGGRGGAWRVHGGGFAGTIMAFVPIGLRDEYIKAQEAVFGSGSCITLAIRNAGGVEVKP